MRGWRRNRSGSDACGAAPGNGAPAPAATDVFAPPTWPPLPIAVPPPPAAAVDPARLAAPPVTPAATIPAATLPTATTPPASTPPATAPPVSATAAVDHRLPQPPAPAPAPAPAPPPAAASLRETAELLRLFEVVTNMCDHVIEYIEAERAERTMLIETLTRLGRAITDGAANATAAANAAATAAATTTATAANGSRHDRELRERVIGGSMPAGPEPVIDLRQPDPPAVASSTAVPVEAAEVSASVPIKIAVEVKGRFGDRWVDGFEICEVMTTPEGPRYRLRRHRDGVVLPELFDATSIRHVETFEELNGAEVSLESTDAAHVPPRLDELNGSSGYWSRS